MGLGATDSPGRTGFAGTLEPRRRECQPWGDDGEGFVKDPACASFAQRAGRRAAITTVRDPLASRILDRLKVPHHCLPCPAFLARNAGRRQPIKTG